MPTGYTASIYDGSEDPIAYMRSCARAFGALIEFRDSPVTDQLPELPETLPDDAYERRTLAEAQQRLARIRGWSEAEAMAEFDKARELVETSNREYAERKANLRARYEKVLAVVRTFEPPTEDHADYAEFLVSQLEGAIEFDCPQVSWISEFGYTDWTVWWAAAIDDAEHRVAACEESLTKAIERAEGRYAWVKALNDALVDFEAKLGNGTLVHRAGA